MQSLIGYLIYCVNRYKNMRLMTLLIVAMLLASCADDIDASVQPPSTAVTMFLRENQFFQIN